MSELSISKLSKRTRNRMSIAQMEVIVDCKQGFAYLRPRKTPGLRPALGPRTLVFVSPHVGSDDLVARVGHLSAASEAGVAHDDVLLKVGERDVATWRTDPSGKWQTRDPCFPFLNPLTNSFAGNKLALTLKRRDEMVTVAVVPEDIVIFVPTTNSLALRSK